MIRFVNLNINLKINWVEKKKNGKMGLITLNACLTLASFRKYIKWFV